MENSGKSVACNIQAKMLDLMVSLTQTCNMTSSIANHQQTHNWSQECQPLI